MIKTDTLKSLHRNIILEHTISVQEKFESHGHKIYPHIPEFLCVPYIYFHYAPDVLFFVNFLRQEYSRKILISKAQERRWRFSDSLLKKKKIGTTLLSKAQEAVERRVFDSRVFIDSDASESFFLFVLVYTKNVAAKNPSRCNKESE